MSEIFHNVIENVNWVVRICNNCESYGYSYEIINNFNRKGFFFILKNNRETNVLKKGLKTENLTVHLQQWLLLIKEKNKNMFGPLINFSYTHTHRCKYMYAWNCIFCWELELILHKWIISCIHYSFDGDFDLLYELVNTTFSLIYFSFSISCIKLLFYNELNLQIALPSYYQSSDDIYRCFSRNLLIIKY